MESLFQSRHVLGHGAAQCDIKVLILLYSNDKKAYLGFIPNDQAQFVDRIRMVIQQQKSKQAMVSNQMLETSINLLNRKRNKFDSSVYRVSL